MTSAPLVTWNATDDPHPARAAALRSITCASAKRKEEWLALFADDGVVEDPVGPSMFDADGNGHRGKQALSAFWDLTIGATESLEFVIEQSFAAGAEVANVGVITARFPGGMRSDTHGVYTYRVDENGLITSLRAFWEFERTLASVTQEGHS